MFSKRLTAKIIGSVLIVYMIVTFLISMMQLNQQYSESKIDVLQHLQVAGSSLGDSITYAIYNYDEESLEETMRGLIQFPEVVGVEIHQVSSDSFFVLGQVLSPSAKILHLQDFSGELDSDVYQNYSGEEADREDLISTKLVIKYKGDPDAESISLTLFSSVSIVQKRVQDALKTIIINTVTQIFTLALILVFLMKFLVSKPLKKLQQAAIAMNPEKGTGSYSTDLIQQSHLLNRKDEFGSLANTMESMRQAIYQADKEIHDYSDNLELKVNERTRELEEKNKEISTLIEKMPIGIMVIEEGNVIGSHYSPELTNIFDIKGNIEGLAFAELLDLVSSLSSDLKSQALSCIESLFGYESIAFSINAHLLPSSGEILAKNGKRYAEFSWVPILDGRNCVSKILFCVRDITLIKELERKSEVKQLQMDLMTQVLDRGVDRLRSQIRSINDLNNGIQDRFVRLTQDLVEGKEVSALLLRELHTLKGNTRTLKFQKVADQVHEMEALIAEHKIETLPNLQSFRDLNLELNESVVKINEAFDRITSLVSGNESKNLLNFERCHALWSLAISLEKNELNPQVTVLEAIQDVIQPYYETVSSLLSFSIQESQKVCSRLNKGDLSVSFIPEDTLVPKSQQTYLEQIFNHLLTNSVIHGIPDSHDDYYRQPEIKIHSWWENEVLYMIVKDSGKGLHLTALREKARSLHPSDADRMTDLELANLIFESGVSTAQRVCNLAGRGVGMDAVKSFVEEEGGSIEIMIEKDQPIQGYLAFSFRLVVPMTSKHLLEDIHG